MSRSYGKTVTTPTWCLLSEAALAIVGRLKSCHVDHKAHQRKKYLFGLERKKSAGPCPDLGPGRTPALVFHISKATLMGSGYRGTGRRTLPRVPDWLGEKSSLGKAQMKSLKRLPQTCRLSSGAFRKSALISAMA